MKKSTFLTLMLLFTVFLYSEKLLCQSNCTASLLPTLSIENIDEFYIPFQHGIDNMIPMPSFEKQNRETIDLAGTWKKQRFYANHDYSLQNRETGGLINIIYESGGRYLPEYDDSDWESFAIPMVENRMHYYNDVPEIHYDQNPGEFNGGVWYRRHFQIPDGQEPRFYKLIFYSVCYICDVWLNGQYLGYHEGGYTPFSFDITDKVNYGAGEDNVIAIRVDNPPLSEPPDPNFFRNDLVPCSNQLGWFNYTGIIQDVYIEASNLISTIRADVVPLDLSGNLKTTVTLFNKSSMDRTVRLCLEVYEADVNSLNWTTEKASELINTILPPVATMYYNVSIISGQARVVRNILNIPNPRLWYPANNGNPYSNLYVLRVRLTDTTAYTDLDDYYTQFGIRTIENRNHRTYINDKISFLTGSARHEDHPDRGRSVTNEIIWHDLLEIRDDLKCNWLRTGHYPNDLYTYLIADRLGLAVMEEIPLWWFTPDAWVCQETRQIHYQMFREMFFKDYNRPSVFLWGIQNENDVAGNNYVSNFIQNVTNEINLFNYPDRRFIGQSAASHNVFIDPKNCGQDPSQSYCSVSAWTMYVPSLEPWQCHMPLDIFLDVQHNYLPDKSIIATEYGASYDTAYINNRFNAFLPRAPLGSDGSLNCEGFVTAITYWSSFDFYSTGRWEGDPYGHIDPFGLCDLYRYIKPTPHSSLVINTYSPYYGFGGIYHDPDPCDNNNLEKLSLSNPFRFSISQNYPNPFNSSSLIVYEIAKASNVSIKIYDVIGRLVTELVNEFKDAGNYSVVFDGTNLASGLYFYKIKAGNFEMVKKMVLIK